MHDKYKEIFWGVRDAISGTEAESNNDVYEIGGDIYFNCAVTKQSITKLINLSRGYVLNRTSPNKRCDYVLYINSNGGYVTEMFRFIDFFETFIKPMCHKKVSIICGMAASAASIISAIFPERKITKNSTIMIHEISAGIWDYFSMMEQEIKWLKMYMEKIIKIYTDATGLKYDTVKQMLLKNTWLDADEALKLKFVNAVV